MLIRRQIALELGIVVPPIRMRDNMQLEPNKYVIKLKGVLLAQGVYDHYLAMNPGDAPDLQGIDTTEPAFGLPAKWISEEQREEAEILGYTVVDPPSVLATHLTEFIKDHAAEIITRQDIQGLIDYVRKDYPAVVDEVIPKSLTLSEFHKIIANLLKERIPIRDMVSIFEALGDYSSITKDLDLLTEYVRQALSRQISSLYATEEGKLYVLTLEPKVEQLIRESIQETEQGNYIVMPPQKMQLISQAISNYLQQFAVMGIQVVILVHR